MTVGDGTQAVLKVTLHEHINDVYSVSRARRIVDHMRGHGYPTPAWLGVGATPTHVWHVMEFVDAEPATRLTGPLISQVLETVEIQAGQATEPFDHSWYAWRVASGQENIVAKISGSSPSVSHLIQRLPVTLPGSTSPPAASDMVHSDFNPSNFLVRGGSLVAVVDIENAGSGTRASDLTTLLWHMFDDELDEVRAQVWERVFSLVPWEDAAMLASTQVLLQLEWPIRLGRHVLVDEVIQRGHRMIDELSGFR